MTSSNSCVSAVISASLRFPSGEWGAATSAPVNFANEDRPLQPMRTHECGIHVETCISD